MVALAGILAFVASPCWGGKPEKEENEGRLSPASLDVDTNGCPTTFGDPECEERTEWTLDKTTGSGSFTDPDGAAYISDVIVTTGPTSTILSGSGQIVINKSGEQTPSLASVAASVRLMLTAMVYSRTAKAVGLTKEKAMSAPSSSGISSIRLNALPSARR